MYKCLITGGAGFIGSHLADFLIKDSWDVRIIDNFRTGKKENLEQAKGNYQLFDGSILDTELVREAIDGVDVVFHLAAMVSVPESIKSPLECNEICSTGTLNLLELSKESGVKRFVYAASSASYGKPPEGAVDEKTPLVTLSPYASSKLAGEFHCMAYSNCSDLETVRLRFFNVFGSRQDPSSPYSGVIAIFCNRLLSGAIPTIFGDGKHTRDFVHVSDVVQAVRLAGVTEGIDGNVYNIGTGNSITLLELYRTIAEQTGIDSEPNFGPPREGDVLHSCANIDKAVKDLGFKPNCTLQAGLKDCLDFYRASNV